MTKLKINKALAALMLVASVFAGWQTALIVAILLIIFTDIEEDTKAIMTRVIAFLLVITIINYGWDLINGIWGYLQLIIHNIIGFINSYLSYGNQINLIKLDQYFFVAFGHLFSIVDGGLTIVLTAAKLFFATSILFNKPLKQNGITRKIEGLIAKIINYVTTYGQPVQPAQAVYAQPAPAEPAAPAPAEPAPMTPPMPPQNPGA